MDILNCLHGKNEQCDKRDRFRLSTQKVIFTDFNVLLIKDEMKIITKIIIISITLKVLTNKLFYWFTICCFFLVVYTIATEE